MFIGEYIFSRHKLNASYDIFHSEIRVSHLQITTATSYASLSPLSIFYSQAIQRYFCASSLSLSVEDSPHSYICRTANKGLGVFRE